MPTLQERIDALQAKIDGYNADIAAIDAVTGSNQTMIDCLAVRREHLEAKVTATTETKTIYEEQQTNLAYTYTTQEQTYVDDISSTFSGVWDKYMNTLKINPSLRTGFFSDYGAAVTDFEKEAILKIYFIGEMGAE